MAFRKPWENGAKAYPEADTFADALEGFKRRRKSVMFHMPNTGEAGEKICVVCNGRLADLPLEGEIKSGRTTVYTGGTRTPDRWSTWDYSPKHKSVGNGRHYTCSWAALMLNIFVTYDSLAGRG
jgi:hypothetical protein